MIFIGCNFESRESQVGSHKQKERYCVSKEGKSKLTVLRFPPKKRGGLFEGGGLNRGFTVVIYAFWHY